MALPSKRPSSITTTTIMRAVIAAGTLATAGTITKPPTMRRMLTIRNPTTAAPTTTQAAGTPSASPARAFLFVGYFGGTLLFGDGFVVNRRNGSVLNSGSLVFLAHQVGSTALVDLPAGVARASPTFDLRLHSLQLFVDREEILDLAPRVRKNLVDGVYAVKTRIAIRHRQDFFVVLGLIEHVQHPDGAHFHHAARKTRLID